MNTDFPGNNGTVRLLVKIVSYPSFIFGLSLIVIWSYLYRIGRQDILMDAFTFKDLFSITGVAFIISILAFSSVYYTPSIISTLIIKRDVENYDQYKFIKKNYIATWAITSCTAFLMVLALSWFLPGGKTNSGAMALSFLASSMISVILAVSLNRKRISNKTMFMDRKEMLLFKVKMHLGIPVMIGLASWVYIFPLLLLLSPLKSLPGQSNLSQVFDVLMLGGVVLFTSIIPGAVYLTLNKSTTIFHQTTWVAGTAALVLILLSLLLPVIPALLLNFTMRITGTLDLNPYIYTVSRTIYPEEAFTGGDWSLSKSHDGKFYILQGVSLFSFGNIRLICPEKLKAEYENSMRYVFASRDYDNSKRTSLQNNSNECRLFNISEVKRLSSALDKG
jgi:hypothetical protein